MPKYYPASSRLSTSASDSTNCPLMRLVINLKTSIQKNEIFVEFFLQTEASIFVPKIVSRRVTLYTVLAH